MYIISCIRRIFSNCEINATAQKEGKIVIFEHHENGKI